MQPDAEPAEQVASSLQTYGEKEDSSVDSFSKKRIQGEAKAARGNMRGALECFQAALQLIGTNKILPPPQVAAATIPTSQAAVNAIKNQKLCQQVQLHEPT